MRGRRRLGKEEIVAAEELSCCLGLFTTNRGALVIYNTFSRQKHHINTVERPARTIEHI